MRTKIRLSSEKVEETQAVSRVVESTKRRQGKSGKRIEQIDGRVDRNRE